MNEVFLVYLEDWHFVYQRKNNFGQQIIFIQCLFDFYKSIKSKNEFMKAL